jgi:hypothetical protein
MRLCAILKTAAFASGALAILCTTTHGDSVSRSNAETAGERRLLEWDLTKKFEPGKAYGLGASKTSTKTFDTQSFASKTFRTRSTFDTSAFYSSEFLTKSASYAQKDFVTRTAALPSSTFANKGFVSGKDPVNPAKAALPSISNKNDAPKGFADRDRSYLGPEAERKKQVYNPANGPAGGTTIGHQLTVDEVREILNKSK